MAQKKETGQLKWKRKKWHAILAPTPFGEQQIAETLALDPEELVGRTVEINLMHLTKNMKRQNFNMKFKVELGVLIPGDAFPGKAAQTKDPVTEYLWILDYIF